MDRLSRPRIKDFDLGTGGSEEDFIRLSDVVADVNWTEINLITWLLLEQEYSKKKSDLERKSDSCHWVTVSFDGGDNDNTDSRPFTNQIGYGFEKSKKYAEQLLRAVGVSLPFELLTESQRVALFRYFSSQSNLLLEERYSSVLDLYEALRRRSKFREEFDVLNVLGQGAYGVVYAVQTKLPVQSNFAVKQIKISSFDAYDNIRMALNEAKILKRLGCHPNIVSYVNAWLEVHEDDTETLVPVFFLMMELGHLPLSRWREENPKAKLSNACLFQITNELLTALEWIHDSGCLHLDINPKNVLWSDARCTSIKIADFGLAIVGDICHERRGTLPYVAPEHTSDAKSDVYSAGVTLFEISQLVTTRQELVSRIELRDLQTSVKFLDQILPLMLHKKPNERSTVSQLLSILCQMEEL